MEHAHYNGCRRRTSAIDRIFASWPGWILTSLHLSSEVRDLPATLEQRKISDRAPAAAIFRERPPPGPREPHDPQAPLRPPRLPEGLRTSTGPLWIPRVSHHPRSSPSTRWCFAKAPATLGTLFPGRTQIASPPS
eukprot:1080049-Pyramimonas_sp.AAC.2